MSSLLRIPRGWCEPVYISLKTYHSSIICHYSSFIKPYWFIAQIVELDRQDAKDVYLCWNLRSKCLLLVLYPATFSLRTQMVDQRICLVSTEMTETVST